MTRKIFLVDDEEDLVEMLRLRLEGAGFMVETARDGLEALQKAQSVCPDVVLLDTVMPEIDGWEVCRRLRSSPATRDIPIIIFTAGTTPDREERAKAAGADRIIIKPFEPEELLAALMWSRHPKEGKRSATVSPGPGGCYT